jgi:hypothetical protein
MLQSRQEQLRALEKEYEKVKKQNEQYKIENKDHVQVIETIKDKITEQEEIKKVYSEKVMEKREKYKAYMESLKITKSSQVKKYEALQMNLEKIFYMQRELSIFLKMTNKNYTNGLQFLDLLKEIDGNAGIEQIQKDLRYDDEDQMEEAYQEKEELKDEKVDLTLQDIRDILLNVNTRILNKNLNK